jgi:hypothetical protein
MASARMQQALQKLVEANKLIKEEWDSDPSNNHLAAGCYKGINALSQAMADDDDGEKDSEYTFTRLVESISWLADYYHMKGSDALREGCAHNIDCK